MSLDSESTTIESPTPMEDIGRFVPPMGAYVCAGCCAEIGHPGICEKCGARANEAEHEAKTMRSARQSIPERFRWAAFDDKHELLKRRVPVPAVERVTSLFGRSLPLGIVLTGAAGRGKTALACAMLRRIHDGAKWDSPWRVVDRASRAFFVSAPELLEACDEKRRNEEPPHLLRMARSASVLILDDVRQGKGEDAIDRLIFRRHDQSRTTIATTWMTREEAMNGRGDGFARRLYEVTIEV